MSKGFTLANIVYVISRSVYAFIFKVFFRLDVYGKENIPGEGGFILAGNHLSLIDPPGFGVACHRRLSYMAKRELFDNPVGAWILYSYGVFPVKRGSADLGAMKEAMQRVKDGSGLLLFPQGTRVKDSEAKPNPGVGFLAVKLQVPVVPAFIKGSDEAWPKGAKFFRLKKVSIYFGKPHRFTEKMPYDEIAAKVMETIGHLEENSLS